MAFLFGSPALCRVSGAQRKLKLAIFAYLCFMKPERLLRAILPDVLIDNFDIVNFDKSADRFDIYLDEKKVQLKEDKTNPDIISYGFGEYRTIQDYPIRGRATYLHVRKRKWLDKSSNEIFSYDWDLSEFDGTRLNSEFVSFLKEGD
ncbi:transposase family protein [Phocaeicola vulgatus]|nr:transposase family protein [Phocaeicola vulgatus]